MVPTDFSNIILGLFRYFLVSFPTDLKDSMYVLIP